MTVSDPGGASEGLAAWHRLHPASPLINLVPQFWRVLRAWWPLLLALFLGSQPGMGTLDVLLAAFFFVTPMVRTVVHWATLRYRVNDGRLEIRSGLLNRQFRIIGPDRIQNSERVRNPLHRLVGLVEVRLETAGGESTEGLLSALTESDAQDLMLALDRLRGRDPATAPEVPSAAAPPLVALGMLELVGHGLSARRVGVLAVAAVVALEVWSQVNPGDLGFLQGGVPPAVVAGVVLGGLVLGALLAVGTSVVRHWSFRLRVEGDRFVVEQGLFTRRRVELPARRIQLLRVDEPFLRRLMGFATLHLETAGLSVGPDGMRQAEATIPMVEREGLAALCRQLVPATDVDPWAGELYRAPIRSMFLGVQRALVRGLFLVGLAVALAGLWGLLALLLVPFLVVAAWFDWNWQAWRISDGAVVARRGFWVRRTWVLPRAKVQSAHHAQGPVLRVWGLASVLVRMAGNQVWLPPLRPSDAAACLSGAAARRAPAAAGRDTLHPGGTAPARRAEDGPRPAPGPGPGGDG